MHTTIVSQVKRAFHLCEIIECVSSCTCDNLYLDNSKDFDKTFDEDEVELLPPATPSNDGGDTVEVTRNGSTHMHALI